ncbi:MAG: type VI secretion system ATPase TssH [Planctomycetes bacterium]|nr:type VI secretion system ATPase TssH [Planctomycetota bacterium]
MASLPFKSLVNKLNPTCQEALGQAATLCVTRTNYEVEIEHFLLKLMEPLTGDMRRVLKQYDVDVGALQRELTRALDKLKTGSGRDTMQFSLDLHHWIREAWVLASLKYQSNRIRSGHLLAAVLSDEALSRSLLDSCPVLKMLPSDRVAQELPVVIAGTSEDQFDVPDAPSASGGESAGRPAGSGQTPALDLYTLNLTERARKGEIDPVIGRDFEIRQVIDILTRRRQNNPILTGEAGVGKTAVVEGFALQVAAGEVPPPLRNVIVRTLDLGLLQAGAGVKGEFENRLKTVIAEVKASPQPIILFIDEAHTMIGAGGSAGQNDAANLLKPALARGELRTIAATTWNEYKKYFETDAALKRRFQVVKVDEPDIPRAIAMMRGIANTMETHHNVRILDEAVEESVKLSHRYITDRQLPDKSVSLLDTACARVALSQAAIPPAIQDCRRDLERLDVELAVLQRESSLGANHDQRVSEIREKKQKVVERLAALEKRWDEEKKLADGIHKLTAKLDAHRTATSEPEASARDGAKPAANAPGSGSKRLTPDEERAAREELATLEKQLVKVQGEEPLVLPVVSGQAIAAVVSGWTGIPLGKMVRDEIQAVLSLKERLEERVIGQSHALDAIAQRIRTSRANLTDPRRPIGVFMLVGPSGVGKTETAVSLAEILFGGDRNMVVINMSEYKEDHKISRLTGSAPGYVGYGEGGVLTEAVRRKPYSVVLLDEVEKANVAVQEIFYQVFDKGMLQDDKGNEINFKNTIILLTSNVGTDTIMKLCADPETRPDPEPLAQALRPDLLKVFKPALLGRISVIPYYPLDDAMLKSIIRLQLKKIGDRLRENHRATFTYDETLLSTISGRCKEVESGARNVDHILSGTLLPELSSAILTRTVDGRPTKAVHVSASAEGKFAYRIE